jgi:hypothetical protein
MATKSGVAQPPKKRPARKSQPQKNYLIVAGDGSLYLASGATGKVSIVDGETTKQVLSLLKQRQQLGRQIAEVLKSRGYEVSSDADFGDIDLRNR